MADEFTLPARVEPTIVIFSSARSGSTWLGKIFDSHPDILYLHEPDIADRGEDLMPYWYTAPPTAEEIEAARRYFTRLITARSIRATGIRPFLRKNYRGAWAHRVRSMLIYAAKGCERAGLRPLAHRIHIPDLADARAPKATVIKSVSGLGRAGTLIQAANGGIRPVLLIRHPCGYVRSMLSGHEKGVMELEPGPGYGDLVKTEAAKRLVRAEDDLKAVSAVERLAWIWLLQNAEAYPAIKAANGAVVVYEKLAGDVMGGAKSLFDSMGLGFPKETEDFIRRSQQNDGSYYSVFRNSEKAANRWRTELSKDVVAAIRGIVTRDPVGRLFFAD